MPSFALPFSYSLKIVPHDGAVLYAESGKRFVVHLTETGLDDARDAAESVRLFVDDTMSFKNKSSRRRPFSPHDFGRIGAKPLFMRVLPK
jgi:hypothetical protein